jgi:Phosphotransferase system mannitol/fructose-specific IIA domain (Ntr-type)
MLINENQVFINLELEKKEEVLKFISEKAFEMNIVESQDRLFKELVERENKYPTAVEELIAIPHSKSANVKEAKNYFL